MASTSTSTIPSKKNYDVLLSFRGIDSRHNIISHLYAALFIKNIKVFIDERSLDRGEEVSLSLLKAIEESKITVIIFSKNYASSRWCLDELVKAMECMKTMNRNVLPIFYDVDPSDVRNQTGSFGEAFDIIKEKFKGSIYRVQKWSTALTEAANLSGWDSRNYRLESELVKDIVDEIMKKLYHISYKFSTDLVGIGSHIEQSLPLLCTGSLNVRFIGIWGMGGIGKTTIAEAIFSVISNQFDGSCFLSNVREKSSKYDLAHLRSTLFSKLLGDENVKIEMSHVLPTFVIDRLGRKKVIIVLDDVNDSEQLDALAGDHSWFGPGSRVIVTSRDKEVLKNVVDEIYKVEGLNDHDSIHLLCNKAFKQRQPPRDYTELVQRVVKYANGVPLALKVLGSNLCKRSPKEWEIVLNKLKKIPDCNIQKVLEISYDELDEMEKDIFLDIACFFKGCEKDEIEDILDGCGFAAEWGIIRLTEKCLVTVVSNRLEMHDLIQEMGLHIAQQKRSRMWNSQEIRLMLTTNMGKKNVEGIFLDMSKAGKIRLDCGTFSRMPKLRLLKFSRTSETFSSMPNSRVKTYRICSPERNKDAIFIFDSAKSNCLHCLPEKLSLLHWEEYPCKSLPSNFFMENLVELNMQGSKIEQLWNDNTGFPRLKRLDLADSVHLKRLPDLSSTTNLEIIHLSHCASLLEIPSSIQYCTKLYSLELYNCKNLRSLPSLIQLENLRILDLRACINLKILPDIPRGLEELALNYSGLEEWQSSVPLDNIKVLSMEYCRNLRSLPSLVHWKSLKSIILYGCENLKFLPEIPSSIEVLLISNSGLVKCSSPTQTLNQLWKFFGANCKNLESLPITINAASALSEIILSGCSNLRTIPKITGDDVTKLVLNQSGIEELPTIKYLPSLVELEMKECLRLKTLPRSINKLKRLKKLLLNGCSNLSHLTPLQGLVSLEELNLEHCLNLTELPPLDVLVSLRELNLGDCKRLQVVQGLPWQVEIFHRNKKDFCVFRFLNCIRLGQIAHRNIMESAQLRIKETAIAKTRDYFCVGIAGNEIPEWITYQSIGCSISIPTNSFNSKFLGFAFCAALEFEAPPFIYRNSHFFISCECHFESTNGDEKDDLSYSLTTFKTIPESDHVFLWYRFDSADLNNWLVNNSCNVKKASFEFKAQYRHLPVNYLYTEKWELEVKSCGIHLIYKEDDMESSSNKKKRNREANLCSNQTNVAIYEEEEPQAKRLNDFDAT